MVLLHERGDRRVHAFGTGCSPLQLQIEPGAEATPGPGHDRHVHRWVEVDGRDHGIELGDNHGGGRIEPIDSIEREEHNR